MSKPMTHAAPVAACSSAEKNSSALRVFVCCSPDRSTPRETSIARPSAATWKASPVGHLVESSRMREPSGYSHISVTSRRPRSPVDFSFSTKIGPSTDRSSRLTPSGACSAKKARCALENSLRTGRSPVTAAVTASGATSPLRDAEQTKPPGIASTSTKKPGVRRSSGASSSGTTGRSLTTESPPLRCTRRARATTPAPLSARSGVSKKNTWRICASSGSRPSAPIAERCDSSGTVSLSSALSAPFMRVSSSVRRSSDKVLRSSVADMRRSLASRARAHNGAHRPLAGCRHHFAPRPTRRPLLVRAASPQAGEGGRGRRREDRLAGKNERTEMPKPIVVGFDPRSADRAPVQFGMAAARFTGAPLIVASAYSDSLVVGQMGHGQMHEDLGGDADEALRHIRTELSRDHHVRAECVGLPGTSAPAALHRAAEERDAGLLVVGSRRNGHSGLLRPGSTAERLMHGAPCPLAIVPGGWTAGGGLRTLGVAYTDTPEGHEALHSAIALARRAEAKLRVLTAVKPHAYGKVAGSGPGTEGTSYDASGTESEHMTQQILEEAAAEAGGIDVETDVSVQDAADFLIAASQNVDLLICGSRGYGPKRAVLLGGVSRRVATESSCPVIVLARGIDFGLEALVGEEQHATV